MAVGDFLVFDEALAYLYDGGWDPSDTIKIAILDNTTTPASGDVTPSLGDYTEVGTGGTYVSGGTSLGTFGDAVTESSGTMTFDSAVNPSWALDAGNDVDAYWALIYNDTDASDLAIGFLDLGGPFDMSAADLEITWNDDGIFTVSAKATNQNLIDIAALSNADGNFIVGDGSNFIVESGSTVISTLGASLTSDQVVYGQLEQSSGLLWDDTDSKLTIDGIDIWEPYSECLAVGQNALIGLVSGVGRTVAIGTNAGRNTTSGHGNFFLGNQSGRYCNGANNIAIGINALYGVSGSTNGSYNVAMGSGSMQNSTTAGSSVGVGYQTLFNLTTGGSNVAIGRSAITASTTTASAVVIGAFAAQNTTVGTGFVAVGALALNDTVSNGLDYCVGIGYWALRSVTGDVTNTVAMGYYAGYASDGTSSVYIGANSGRTASGNDNVCVGEGSGYTTIGSSNVLIGHDCGSAFTSGVANTLAIHNSNSNQALVYGEFSDRNFGFNFTEGTDSFGASSQGVVFIHEKSTNPTGNPSGGGVLYVDSGALKYRGPGGTTTTIAPT